LKSTELLCKTYDANLPITQKDKYPAATISITKYHLVLRPLIHAAKVSALCSATINLHFKLSTAGSKAIPDAAANIWNALK